MPFVGVESPSHIANHELLVVVLLDAELAIQGIHANRVVEDQDQKDVNRSLLGKPESKIGSANGNGAQQRPQDDPEAERDERPDDQANRHQTQISAPVR